METDNEENEEEDANAGDEPLFPGSRLTLGESLLSILTFFLSESLTGVGLVRLLRLIEMHCLAPNKCIKSLYFFKKYFSKSQTPVRRHFYCTNCMCPLQDSKATCGICHEKDKNVSFFIEIPVMDQLKKLYNRFDFYHLLQSKYNRKKMNANNYEDIYDGQIYKEKSRPGGPLSNSNNISFMWNTDGVSLFKSSNFQIWPLFLTINELPFHLRSKKENLILAGLWFGPDKPLPAYFLHSISVELNELANGVDFYVPALQDSIRVEGHVICGTCDLPAKSLFLNLLQYNGSYGCAKCKIHVTRFQENKHIPVYKFQDELYLRTQKETIEFGKLAVEKEVDHIFGVKAVSVINEFESNYIRSTFIDVMHCVYLGVVKSLLHLWFSSNFISCPWSLAGLVAIVDKLLCAMTPPEFITRLPRSISKHLPYWKAHELKTWFYYYSLPILETIMVGEKRQYFEHYKLLVTGISLLNQSSVSNEMINHAEQLLIRFVEQFEGLYGEQFMTANLHNLLHLADTVRDGGPLFVTSCFSFENMNGQLSRLVTGTRFSGLQISTGLSYFMTIPRLLEDVDIDSIAFDYITHLTNPKKKYKSHKLSAKLYAIGAVSKTNTVPHIISNTVQSLSIENSNIKIFFRLMKLKLLYTSELYLRMTKTDSSFIKYNVNGQPGYGRISCFLQTSNCTCKSYCHEACNAEYFAVINKYYVVNRFFSSIPESNRIYECWPDDEILAINVTDLICVCFFIDIKSPRRQYIIEPINLMEVE